MNKSASLEPVAVNRSVGFLSLLQSDVHTACELALRCRGAEPFERVRKAIASVIMCQATLEAFLNDLSSAAT